MRAPRPGIAKASDLPMGSRSFVRSVLEDLDALIAEEARASLAAVAWGDSVEGGVGLVRRGPHIEPEGLRVCWSSGEIDRIEIESRSDINFWHEGTTVELAAAIDELVPKLWDHIRGGGEVPHGVERFAGFLSRT